jgi:ribonuclease D
MPARRLGRCSLECLGEEDARLARVLSKWRTEVAATMGLEPHDLASDRALFALVSAPPGTHFELQSVAGLYQAGVSEFGRDLVDRIRAARSTSELLT